MIIEITTHADGEIVSTGTHGFGKPESSSIDTIIIKFPPGNKIHETDEFKTMWEAIEYLGKKHYSPITS